MSRFVFKLETLLRHREQIERAKQVELARATTRLTALQNQLTELTAASREASADVAKNRQFLAKLSTQIAALRRDIRDAASEIAAAREAFAAAARDRKAIERLREKALQEWKRQQAKAEQRILDDVAARR